MSQDDFTSDAYARKDDLDTSHKAADKVRRGDAERKVHEAFIRGGPANGREIAARTGIDLNTVTPRLRPLRDKGKITFALDKDGERIRRDGQYVWAAVVEA